MRVVTGKSESRFTHVDGARLEDAGGASVRVAPAAPCALLNLRGRPEDDTFAASVERIVGIRLPEAPNRWSGEDGFAIAWLGPDEWLIMVRDRQAGDIENGLREARPDDPWLSVVDVSHNYTGFVLTGTKTREALAKGCSLDLHPRNFGQGDCAQTLVAKSRALLRCVDDGESVEIWVRNSFACYIAAWLVDAMEEFRDPKG